MSFFIARRIIFNAEQSNEEAVQLRRETSKQLFLTIPTLVPEWAIAE